ncbi:MAG TPA: hypothetical protein VK709_03425 [Candidatus Saccharimonadales bacterium]|jgi:hypothetical protein|nr:hypothetical protein [Candidatus Saccharimonadales bacterium]
MRITTAIIVIALVSLIESSAPVMAKKTERINVRITNRQDSATTYSAVIPGHANYSSSASCYGSGDSVNCSGSGSGYETGPRPISYSVQGATLTLLLPDGRYALVNCTSKYSLKFDYINSRSCRVPIVDDIQVEFDKDNAKLFWAVSLDGKKMESETFKILAVK